MPGLRSRLSRRLVQNDHVIRLGRRLLDTLEIDHLDSLGAEDSGLPTLDERARNLVESLRIERLSHTTALVSPLSGRPFEEVLIAIPFLRWAVRSYSLDRKRIAVLASAELKGWYTPVAGAVVECPDDARAHEPRWVEPLRALSSAATTGELAPLTLFRFLEHERLPRPQRLGARPSDGQPVVVTVDFPSGFPPTPENRDLLMGVARHLDAAVSAKVVEVPVPQDSQPRGKLAETGAGGRQAALSSRIDLLGSAVAGASALVAPLCSDAVALGLVFGIPCVGLAPQATARMEVVDFMLRVARRLKTPLSVLEPSELELVGSLLPGSNARA